MSLHIKENRKAVTKRTSLPDGKEDEIEAKFKRECLKHGGIARKQTAGGGDLDRRVVWPNGVTTYAEIKRRHGGEASKLQEAEVELLTEMGHLAMFIRNELDIALFIKRSLERVREAG